MSTKNIIDIQTILEAGKSAELEDDKVTKPRQADIVVEYALEHYEFFPNENGTVYASNRTNGVIQPVDGRRFSDELRASFYIDNQSTISDTAFGIAKTTLNGLTRISEDSRDVHIRVAVHDGGYLIDLAETGQTRCIFVHRGGWELLDQSPVHFFRPTATQPLPFPDRAGSIDPLWQIVNITPADRVLIVAWILESFRPDTPYPILELLGMAGSAKSTTHWALREVIDPNSENLRTIPKAVDDLFVIANANHILSFENLSSLSWQMQDAMCTVATGGGYAKRMLYTDADEIVLKAKRPIIANGISAAITRQDAVDRTVSLELEPLAERKNIAELKSEFDALRSIVFGGLLNIMADALQRLPKMNLSSSERPRLVEFAYFGMAIAESMGMNRTVFMCQFNERRQETIARTIDASPTATALVEWFTKKGSPTREAPLKVLFTEIENHKPKRAENWPRSAKGFGDELRRAAPALLQLGIEIKSLGKRGGNMHWRIAPKNRDGS